MKAAKEASGGNDDFYRRDDNGMSSNIPKPAGQEIRV
jgi:hypothetical protein